MLSIATLALVAVPTVVPPACLELEPSVSELVGIVEERTFPGPPNYGESPTDSQETQLILVLVAPICVVAPDDAPRDASWARIDEVTLVPNSISSQPIPRGKRVKVVGTLFEAHTGHHHTPVLITVQSVAEVV